MIFFIYFKNSVLLQTQLTKQQIYTTTVTEEHSDNSVYCIYIEILL